MNRTFIAAAAALAALVSAPLALSDTAAPEVITVTAGDLDLATHAGAKSMLTRIDAAAVKACWPEELSKMGVYQACRTGVMLDAVKVLDEPMVSLVYAEMYPTKQKTIIVASR